MKLPPGAVFRPAVISSKFSANINTPRPKSCRSLTTIDGALRGERCNLMSQVICLAGFPFERSTADKHSLVPIYVMAIPCVEFIQGHVLSRLFGQKGKKQYENRVCHDLPHFPFDLRLQTLPGLRAGSGWGTWQCTPPLLGALGGTARKNICNFVCCGVL